MKKFLLVIIFLLVIAAGAWVGTTYLFGSKTSEWITAKLDQLREQTGASEVIDANQTSYTPGFFSSQATTKLQPVAPFNQGDEGLRLNHVVYHGPLAKTPDGFKLASNYMVTTISREDFSEEVNDILDKGFGGKEPMTLTIDGGFGESIGGTWEIPPFSLDAAEFGEVGHIEFAGLDGDFNLSQTEGKVNLSIGAMKVEGTEGGEEFLMEMEKATMNTDMRKMIGGKIVIDGNSSLNFPSFHFSGDGVSVRIKDLSMTSEVKPSGEAIGADLVLSVGEVKLPAEPGLDPIRPILANGAKMTMDFSGISIDALTTMVESQERIQKAQAEMDSKGTSEMTPQMIGEASEAANDMIRAFLGMLQKGSTMGMGLVLGDGAGKSEMKLSLTYTGSGKLNDLKTAQQLASAFEGEFRIQLDKSLVPPDQVGELRQPIAQGMVADKGTHYEAVVKLSGGSLDVNGQLMPLLQMMGVEDPSMPIPWDLLIMGAAMGLQQQQSMF